MAYDYVAWNPTRELLATIVSLLVYTAFYFLTTRRFEKSTTLAYTTAVELVRVGLTVIGPAYYIQQWHGGDGTAIGLQAKSARAVGGALVLQLLLAAFCWKGLQKTAKEKNLSSQSLAFHLVFNTLVIWEPFHCHGVLQLIFARAFGSIAAVILTGVAHGAYHLGTYPIVGGTGQSCASLAGFSCGFAGIYALGGHSLFVLCPLLWGVSCSIGTLEGGFVFTRDMCIAEAVADTVAVVSLSCLLLL